MWTHRHSSLVNVNQHQLNLLLTATTTCLSVYCQTITTFSTTYCLTRLITNTIFETAVTIAHCVLKQMRKTFYQTVFKRFI